MRRWRHDTHEAPRDPDCEAEMALRRLITALLAVLGLAACGGPVPSQPATVVFVPTSAATEPAVSTQAPAPATAALPTAVLAPTAAPAPTSAPAPTAQPNASAGSELLFLRERALIAFDLGTRKERTLADQVLEFAPAPDGRSCGAMVAACAS
jgi:hypothetical protein